MNRRTFLFQLGMATAALCIPYAVFAEDKKPCLLLFDKLRDYIRTHLGIALQDNFYTEWKEGYQYYLYVSEKNEVKRPEEEPYFRFFGSDEDKAKLKQQALIAAGYDTLLYRTAATSAAKVYAPLATYPNHCLSFISFHEAHHIHRKANNRKAIPYSFEEAAGDVLGNYVSLDFALLFPDALDLKAVKHQVKVNESLYKKINATRKKIDQGRNKAKAYQKLEQFIQNKLAHEDLFKKDRFLYPINNAFFIRYGYYTTHYFLLKALYIKVKSAKAFLALLDQLPTEEAAAITQVKAWLKEG